MFIHLMLRLYFCSVYIQSDYFEEVDTGYCFSKWTNSSVAVFCLFFKLMSVNGVWLGTSLTPLEEHELGYLH